MKKILFISFVVIIIVYIYFLNVDRKVFFVAIGDSLALGKTDNSIIENNYNKCIKDQLQKEKILEEYIDNYSSSDLRISDVINDINNNKKIYLEGKSYNLKHLLIKADLVTVSVNHDEVFNKLNSNYSDKELYEWVDEITNEYENMMYLLRQYCKEKIYVIGYYYPLSLNLNFQRWNVLSYLNDALRNISTIYEIDYINTFDVITEGENLLIDNYPTELGHKIIGEQILLKYNE